MQSFNGEGIKAYFAARRDPTLVMPHLRASSLTKVPAAVLWHAGIRSIAIDLDNTLTNPYSNEIPPFLANAVNEYKHWFAGHIAILSNSAGTRDDRGNRKAQALFEAHDINVITHRPKKPGCVQDVYDYFGLRDGRQLACIGDRLFTDIAMGNNLGALSILTQPFTDVGDNPFAAKVRSWERGYLRRLDAQGVRARYHPAAQNIIANIPIDQLTFIVSPLGSRPSDYDMFIASAKK